MNYFTKDELKDLLSVLNESIAEGTQPECVHFLRDKIQSMLDNYCEHEWENICCQCTMDKIYCHKCEKDMGNLKERYNE